LLELKVEEEGAREREENVADDQEEEDFQNSIDLRDQGILRTVIADQFRGKKAMGPESNSYKNYHYPVKTQQAGINQRIMSQMRHQQMTESH